jgi:hypothetical protein
VLERGLLNRRQSSKNKMLASTAAVVAAAAVSFEKYEKTAEFDCDVDNQKAVGRRS